MLLLMIQVIHDVEILTGDEYYKTYADEFNDDS